MANRRAERINESEERLVGRPPLGYEYEPDHPLVIRDHRRVELVVLNPKIENGKTPARVVFPKFRVPLVPFILN